jgi:hypothetical protein
MSDEASEPDFAATSAAVWPTRRDEIERKRRVAHYLIQCEELVGLPEEDRSMAHLHEQGWLDDWAEKILRHAMAKPGRLDPRRYRIIWMINNACKRTSRAVRDG